MEIVSYFSNTQIIPCKGLPLIGKAGSAGDLLFLPETEILQCLWCLWLRLLWESKWLPKSTTKKLKQALLIQSWFWEPWRNANITDCFQGISASNWYYLTMLDLLWGNILFLEWMGIIIPKVGYSFFIYFFKVYIHLGLNG